MQSSLYHRGPDSKGFWLSENDMIGLFIPDCQFWIYQKVATNLCTHHVEDTQ